MTKALTALPRLNKGSFAIHLPGLINPSASHLRG